jgi:2-dehydro-3-deoxy-L-rhamnonate dehydrogenase (NAD+)
VRELENQIAVVTGAAQGLGLAIAKRLASDGARIAMLDFQSGPLQAAAKTLGDAAQAFEVDVTSQEKVERVIAQVAETFGKIDILVNSAGVTGKTNIKSHEVEADDMRHVFDVNFMGCFFTSRAVLPLMLNPNYGRIHIASIAGKEGNAGMLAYSASKAAVIGMTKVQGKEYAETGITINAIAPAVIRTAMVAALPPEQSKFIEGKIPMKRCGTLEEVAHLVSFIVSPGASFNTGFTFDLTGGRATY